MTENQLSDVSKRRMELSLFDLFYNVWNDPYCDLLGMNRMIRIVIFALKLMSIRALQSKRVT